MFSMKLLFNNYFRSITENLDLLEWPDEPKFNIFGEIDIIVNKFWFHPRIIKLKQKFSIKKKIAFNPYTEDFFKNIINDLSWNEADGGAILINLIKESTFIFCTLQYVFPGEEILWKGTVSAEFRANRRKLCLSTKCPHQEIRWKFGILRSVAHCVNEDLVKS